MSLFEEIVYNILYTLFVIWSMGECWRLCVCFHLDLSHWKWSVTLASVLCVGMEWLYHIIPYHIESFIFFMPILNTSYLFSIKNGLKSHSHYLFMEETNVLPEPYFFIYAPCFGLSSTQRCCVALWERYVDACQILLRYTVVECRTNEVPLLNQWFNDSLRNQSNIYFLRNYWGFFYGASHYHVANLFGSFKCAHPSIHLCIIYVKLRSRGQNNNGCSLVCLSYLVHGVHQDWGW